MAYKKGENRSQITLLPQSVDEYISDENPSRLIDAFVDSLDMKECGFARYVPAATGTPGYDPRDLLKLYIYAYFNKIRSSRKIAKEATRNVEVMWLIEKLMPDFRTISDFRKDNVVALKEVYRRWNHLCAKLGLYGKEYVSIDGSKFKAVNSKDRNFTLSKLDDRLKRLDDHIDDYVAMLDHADAEESDERTFTKEELEEKIKDLRIRRETYESYRDEMETSGEKQKSLTDPESRLMKFKEGYEVGYNIQTAVDGKSHMIAEFLVTDHATDHGLIEEVADSVRKEFELETIEAVADKGYQDTKDMLSCLENGIIPNVHPPEAGGSFELEAKYEPAEISETQRQSRKAEDIKECLRAGVVPAMYESVIEEIGIAEKSYRTKNRAEETVRQLSAEKMIAKAAEGYFIRDEERDRVYCPTGHILRPKAIKKNGSVRYCNKLACKNCKRKCTTAKWKEIDFAPGKTEIAVRARGNANIMTRTVPGITERRMKYVKIKFKPDQRKLGMRMSLSEHPFGTVKRWNDGSYLLLKGKEKVTGELSLSFMIYNMKRAINMIGIRELIAAMG